MSKVRHKILPRDNDSTRALIKAQRRIENPKHWCKGVFARDAEGNMVSITSSQFSSASQFCAMGALYTTRYHSAVAGLILRRSSMHVSGKNMSKANDSMDHEMVMHIYDYAIEQSRRKGKA